MLGQEGESVQTDDAAWPETRAKLRSCCLHLVSVMTFGVMYGITDSTEPDQDKMFLLNLL